MAHFDRVLAVSFAFPTEVLRPLVPAPLEIDAFEDFGFVTVAMVWTRGLRPAAFPAVLGQDFFLAGYRIFVRMHDESGRRLRGLKILRSETDKARMVISGNLLTHYNYRRITLDQSPGSVKTTLPDGTVTLEIGYDDREDAELPKGSPFPDWRTARRFAGPMPFTFDREGDGRFVVIEGKRADWTPRPVDITGWKVGLFDEPPFHGVTPVLANAFLVENVPYRWERGRLITPQPRKEEADA
ncbi:DUF2071 domain-containing protein [Luteolibacter arcticus]|uniref:DUF2071 domain-containing protein n=1 Tax=Luteolibacter arcticus TaxID=1581411 RepID=A0ABT3GBZ9_9BACT|nr:DUF2071 domain-containing protein [Luteolibacter arcticus]MCW1921094.1 DUF2071 domain-containing protein [Luteolibacter arcticus]